MSFRLWKQKVENPLGQKQTQQVAGSMSKCKTNDSIKSSLINCNEDFLRQHTLVTEMHNRKIKHVKF